MKLKYWDYKTSLFNPIIKYKNSFILKRGLHGTYPKIGIRNKMEQTTVKILVSQRVVSTLFCIMWACKCERIFFAVCLVMTKKCLMCTPIKHRRRKLWWLHKRMCNHQDQPAHEIDYKTYLSTSIRCSWWKCFKIKNTLAEYGSTCSFLCWRILWFFSKFLEIKKVSVSHPSFYFSVLVSYAWLSRLKDWLSLWILSSVKGLHACPRVFHPSFPGIKFGISSLQVFKMYSRVWRSFWHVQSWIWAVSVYQTGRHFEKFLLNLITSLDNI